MFVTPTFARFLKLRRICITEAFMGTIMKDSELFILSSLEDKDRIAILMQEYATLRAEIIARTGFGFQLAGITAAALTWFVGQRLWDPALSPLPPWALAALGIIVFVVVILFRVNKRDIWKAAARLREIEHEVNSRAGERLLIWETAAGAGRMSFWRSLISRVPITAREKLPSLDPKYIQRRLDKAMNEPDKK